MTSIENSSSLPSTEEVIFEIQNNLARHQKSDGLKQWSQTIVFALVGLGILITLQIKLKTAPSQVHAEVIKAEKHIVKSEKSLAKKIGALTERIDDAISGSDVLEQNQALFVATLNDSTDVIIALDKSGKIIAWSAGAEKELGYKRSNVVGYGIKFLMPEKGGSKHIQSFASAMIRTEENTATRLNRVDCEVKHQSGRLITKSIHTRAVPGGVAVSYFLDPVLND